MIAEDNALVQRVALSSYEQEQSDLLTNQFVDELKQRSRLYEKRSSILNELASSFLPKPSADGDRAKEAVETFGQLHTQTFEEKRIRLKDYIGNSDAMTAYHMHVDSQLSLSSPPYDAEQTGGVIAYAHKDTGEFGVSPMNGFAWAGVAINVTTSVNSIGRFTAYAPIEYGYSNWVWEDGVAGSYGGISTRVFNLTDPNAFVINETGQLFSNTQYGNGIQDLSDTSSLGYTNAAETYFIFNAGHVYQIWVWCWAGTSMTGNAVAFANVNCKMPFVVVKPMHL